MSYLHKHDFLERFGSRNKSGKCLANQLKSNKEKKTISSVTDPTGNTTLASTCNKLRL